MRSTDSSHTKVTPTAILKLYHALMDAHRQDPASATRLFIQQDVPNTFQMVAVMVKRPNTTDADLWFYRFPDRETPVAKITGMGEYLTRSTYDLPNGKRVVIQDTDIQATLAGMLRLSQQSEVVDHEQQ